MPSIAARNEELVDRYSDSVDFDGDPNVPEYPFEAFGKPAQPVRTLSEELTLRIDGYDRSIRYLKAQIRRYTAKRKALAGARKSIRLSIY